jgi:hypothetical protein
MLEIDSDSEDDDAVMTVEQWDTQNELRLEEDPLPQPYRMIDALVRDIVNKAQSESSPCPTSHSLLLLLAAIIFTPKDPNAHPTSEPTTTSTTTTTTSGGAGSALTAPAPDGPPKPYYPLAKPDRTNTTGLGLDPSPFPCPSPSTPLLTSLFWGGE